MPYRRQRSFNAIHLTTMFKVDVFCHGHQPFDRSQYERRVLASLTEEPGHNAYVASPEDNVLAKLNWYRMGGEVSDRQWARRRDRHRRPGRAAGPGVSSSLGRTTGCGGIAGKSPDVSSTEAG